LTASRGNKRRGGDWGGVTVGLKRGKETGGGKLTGSRKCRGGRGPGEGKEVVRQGERGGWGSAGLGPEAEIGRGEKTWETMVWTGGGKEGKGHSLEETIKGKKV